MLCPVFEVCNVTLTLELDGQTDMSIGYAVSKLKTFEYVNFTSFSDVFNSYVYLGPSPLNVIQIWLQYTMFHMSQKEQQKVRCFCDILILKFVQKDKIKAICKECSQE